MTELTELKQLIIAGFEALGLQVERKTEFVASEYEGSHEFVGYEVKKKPKAKREKKEVEYSFLFEQLWKKKPHRAGNSKQDANKEMLAKMGKGVEYKDINEGIERYAAYVKATNDQCVYKLNNFIKKDLFLESWDIPKDTVKQSLPRDNEKLPTFAAKHGLREANIGESWPAYRKYIEDNI